MNKTKSKKESGKKVKNQAITNQVKNQIIIQNQEKIEK